MQFFTVINNFSDFYTLGQGNEGEKKKGLKNIKSYFLKSKLHVP